MKSRLYSLFCMLAVAALVAVALPSCGGDDGDEPVTPTPVNNNGGDNNGNNEPTASDPEGTQDMALKVGNNASVINGVSYVDAQYNLTGGQMVSMGKLKGLGDITNIPKTGWRTSSAMNIGEGYVVYNEATEVFCRMYVVGQDGEGYHVKYQVPFKGASESLALSSSDLSFPPEGGTRELSIANTSIIPFTVSSTEPWCIVEKIQPGTGIKITCEPSAMGRVSSAAITLVQVSNGENRTLNVTREGITHNAIDLGLSVLWSDRYVGATAVEGVGSYFAWGETATKDGPFYWETYAYRSGSSSVTDIGAIISGTEYDAATASLGEGWRMPTRAEFYELRNKCKWTQTTVNGVSGVTATGPNGNSVFFADRGGYNVTGDPSRADCAYIWLANKSQYRKEAADNFYFGGYVGGDVNPVVDDGYGKERWYGLQVRAVKGQPYSDPESNYTASGNVGGHDYIDLGLSVKWATCNLGATSTWDYGNYYNWSSSRSDWGSSWRMPTREEAEELVACNIEWTIYHHTGGFRITGPNGKSMFLPAAGKVYIYPSDMDERAQYWTSTSAGGNKVYVIDMNNDVLTYGSPFFYCWEESRYSATYGDSYSRPIRLVTK